MRGSEVAHPAGAGHRDRQAGVSFTASASSASSSNDANARGTLIPTTSVDQYGATLAQWFGVGAGSLAQVFPNIGNFSNNNLGFLG